MSKRKLYALASRETASVAVLSVALGIVETAVFSSTYPAIPPIIVMPFLTCLYFGAITVLSRRLWMIGLVGFVLTIVMRGYILPGQLTIPVYGLLFQATGGRRVYSGIAGFVGSILHLTYGVMIAPRFFSIAPARTVLLWMISYVGEVRLAIVALTVIFGFIGILAADIGYRAGLVIRNKTGARFVQVDVRRVKEEMAR